MEFRHAVSVRTSRFVWRVTSVTLSGLGGSRGKMMSVTLRRRLMSFTLGGQGGSLGKMVSVTLKAEVDVRLGGQGGSLGKIVSVTLK